MEGRTYLTLRDNRTLQPLSSTADRDGRVYDLYNAKIRESINGAFNASFDILPYLDVWQIGYPNIVELENNYFMVREVRHNRSDTLKMTIELDHISYEMNTLEWDEDEQKYIDSFDEDVEYAGNLLNVATEIMQDERFTLNVAVNPYVELTTRKVGRRSRLIELASVAGLEIIWDKFNVYFVERRGLDNGLTFEVGKNIRSLDIRKTTDSGGLLKQSIELDILDLAKLNSPEPIFAAELGDTVRVLDEQFNIDRVERIVSKEYDPFKKALPTIDIENVIADTSSETQGNAVVVSGGGGGGPSKIPFHYSVEEIMTNDRSDELHHHIPLNGDDGYNVKAGQMVNGSLQMCILLTPYDDDREYTNARQFVTGEVKGIGSDTVGFAQYINIDEITILNIPLQFYIREDENIWEVWIEINTDDDLKIEMVPTPWLDSDGGGREGLQLNLEIPTGNGGGSGGNDSNEDDSNNENTSGGCDEVIVSLDNKSKTITFNEDFEENYTWVNFYNNVVVNQDTEVTGAMNLYAKASEDMTVECEIMKGYWYDSQFYYEPVNYTRSITHVKQGYFTVAMPFTDRLFYVENYSTSYHIRIKPSVGQVDVNYYDIGFFVKGRHIQGPPPMS